MTQAQINYTLQGNKKHSDLVKEAKEKVGDNGPDLSKPKYRITIGKTTYYPKSEKRFRELQKLKKESEK
jgi:hypothetical protein